MKITFLKDFNFTFNISFNSSNISKHADNSFNTILTFYNIKNFIQTAINNTTSVIIRINVIIA